MNDGSCSQTSGGSTRYWMTDSTARTPSPYGYQTTHGQQSFSPTGGLSGQNAPINSDRTQRPRQTDFDPSQWSNPYTATSGYGATFETAPHRSTASDGHVETTSAFRMLDSSPSNSHRARTPDNSTATSLQAQLQAYISTGSSSRGYNASSFQSASTHLSDIPETRTHRIDINVQRESGTASLRIEGIRDSKKSIRGHINSITNPSQRSEMLNKYNSLSARTNSDIKIARSFMSSSTRMSKELFDSLRDHAENWRNFSSDVSDIVSKQPASEQTTQSINNTLEDLSTYKTNIFRLLENNPRAPHHLMSTALKRESRTNSLIDQINTRLTSELTAEGAEKLSNTLQSEVSRWEALFRTASQYSTNSRGSLSMDFRQPARREFQHTVQLPPRGDRDFEDSMSALDLNPNQYLR